MRSTFLIGVASTALLAAAASASPSKLTITNDADSPFTAAGGIVFSSPIGNAASGYAEFLESEQKILPPPHYALKNGQIIPGTPHDGPYNNELADGVTTAGFKSGSIFAASDFSNGSGIFVGFMLVPNTAAPAASLVPAQSGPGSVGSSPDSPSAPIIANADFPLTLSGVVKRNGQVFDPAFDTMVPNINDLIGQTPATTYEGASHIPLFFADAAEFGAAGPIAGHYTADFSVKSSSGSGSTVHAEWDIAGPVVVPLPPAALAAIPALILAGGATWKMRRRPAQV